MSEEALEVPIFPKPLIYEVSLPIRGYRFDLARLKRGYEELQSLNDKEGARIVATLQKGRNQSDEEFEAYKVRALKSAFKITVSVVGGENGEIHYGEDASIFTSTDLPFPISTVFMTNVTAWQREAGNSQPPNRINLWIHFFKPPIADPNPLVSEPTQNSSNLSVSAEDLTFFGTSQHIVNKTIMSKRVWYAPIHNKFFYDMGLWLFFFPYSLYIISNIIYVLFSSQFIDIFQFAAFIFGIGCSVIIYRVLFGYMKWALPVNVLDENKDSSAIHRIFFASLVFSVLGNAIYTLIVNIGFFFRS